MVRHRKDLGARKHVRVDLHKPGFLIPKRWKRVM